MAYLGRENNVHDKLLVKALEEKYRVIQKYTVNIPDLMLDGNFFEDCKLIIAGPLTDAILLIPKSISIPILGISHGYDLNLESNNSKLSENIDRCSSIIADCEYIIDILTNKYKYMKEIHNMPFGCDYNYFSTSIPTYSNDILILVTRNWSLVHGNQVIIAALEILLKNQIKFNCSFMGDGPLLTSEIREISTRSGASTINFLGISSKKDIRKEMSNTWLYISAAESDGTSISLLEAMSAGMICLISDFPSNLEWIKHGCNGFLFESNNADNLFKLIKEVSILSIVEKKIIGDRARQTARIKGNWLLNKKTLMSASQKIISFGSVK